MFKSIISRENGDPWGSTGLTSKLWLDIPVQKVQISELIATQNGVFFHPLMSEVEPVGADIYPHVVLWKKELYLEDGHHRALKALLKGQTILMARVLQIS